MTARMNFDDPRTPLPSATPEVMREWSRLSTALRTSVRQSDVAANRYWLARLVILGWALDIALMAFGAPDSMTGKAMAKAGTPAILFMSALLAQTLLALFDSIATGLWPGRWRSACFLMRYRHMGFMLLASQLVICGAGLMRHLNPSPIVFSFFLIPAAFCVTVTVLDLRARHKERRP